MNEEAEPTTERETTWRRVVGWLSPDEWLIVGWVLTIRVLLFIFASRSFQILENKRSPGWFGWIDLWNRWDADQYLKLAKLGYTSTSNWKAWFYPLYPWCIRVVAFFDGNYLVSALLVSLIALIIAALLLRRLIQIDFAAEVALRSVWFFLIFPTAYFLHAPYTEGLFLALALGSILAARKDRWWLAGTLGALAWMTRANGIVLLPTLAVEAGYQFWKTKRWNRRWAWIALVPLGFAVYLLINWHVTGDPFAAFRMRSQMSYTSLNWPWRGIRGAIGIMMGWKPGDAEIVGTQEFVFAMIGLICLVASWIKLRPTYATYITATWLMFASTTFMESMPRYTLAMFPIFILFGLVGENRSWRAAITVWSLLFLALFTSLFVRGGWAF